MSDVNDLSATLRRHGHRLTRPRQLVWDALHEAHGHITAEQVAERVKARDADVNLASVYRSLALFAELDLARESRLAGQGAARWEPAHPDDHFHLVCRDCGEVHHHAGDLVAQVREHLSSSHQFHADGIDLVVTGRCAACTAAAGAS